MSLWVHVSLGQDSCLELPLLHRSTQDNQLGQQVHMYKYLYMYMHSKTRLHQDRAVACSPTCQITVPHTGAKLRATKCPSHILERLHI